tara:strand:- start:1403 stop:1612 length:210 start_codon:yes stop_codon:yes gene_type:complete
METRDVKEITRLSFLESMYRKPIKKGVFFSMSSYSAHLKASRNFAGMQHAGQGSSCIAGLSFGKRFKHD